MSGFSEVLSELERVKRDLAALKSSQVFSVPIRTRMLGLAKQYFDKARADLSFSQDENGLAQLDGIFQNLISLSRMSPSRAKCIRLLAEAKKLLLRLEGQGLALRAKSSASSRSRADELIVESLEEICPPAAMAYSQALRDLDGGERLSYRGPATDLREALRETLDTLAPDAEVEAVPGYKAEPDAKRPTMKQKTRYILRNRGMASAQIAVPENSVEGVELIVGGLVRSVYSRTSVSTHTATSRTEVIRIHNWVRIALCELLAIPL